MNLQSLPALLSANTYPGRGIVLGRSPDGTRSVAVYFIMGRSANSRNRVFVPAEDGIRIQAHDPAAMEDPSLVIYHPVRLVSWTLIVTNGDQTDTIRDALAEDAYPASPGELFNQALSTRTFEPDAPNYTPRISGILLSDGSFRLSILKSADGNPDSRCHFIYDYKSPLPGEGRFLHTYQSDGNPLPSFEGEPVRVSIEADTPKALADTVWSALNHDNRVSLYVRYTDLATGEFKDAIRNRFK